MLIRTNLACALGTSFAVAAATALAEERSAAATRPAPMPVSVTPFYDSNGPRVAVGPYGVRLVAADARSILGLAAELAKEKDKLRPEVMYVTAIRLYDLGHKDEAVYWFYSAQFRARVFMDSVDPAQVGGMGSESFELPAAYTAFNQLVGVYINGYAFGDLAKLEKTLAKVQAESKTTPSLADLFPNVKFLPKERWDVEAKAFTDSMSEMIDYLKANANSIKEKRKATGIEGKF